MNAQFNLSSRSIDMRDNAIPLPTRDDGYATVMLVGTTGAGKTTVLRQLIGSDRFPPTSTSRTTTCDIEIVTGETPFAAIVTFMDEREVKGEIENCLHNACRTAIDSRIGASADGRIANALLSPPDQSFRLSYPLGRWAPGAASSRDGAGDEPQQRTLSEYEATSDSEKDYNQEILETIVSKIKSISALAKAETEAAGGRLDDIRRPGDRGTWLELFDEILETNGRFHELVEDILAEIRDRFDRVQTGEFSRDEKGWPLSWQYQSGEQDTFLTEVRWFSGNHGEQFGRLLTPLVNGVRVRGPFAPTDIRLQTSRKLVILDGEGLGHRAQMATSVRSEITDRFSQTDVILLVDNAQQPMLTQPQELVKAAGSTGYAAKLAFAFTHFENVIGDDLYTVDDRKDRVRLPGEDAIATMQSIVGDDVAEELLRQLERSTFFLENMDRPTAQLPSQSITELRRLLDTIEAAAHPEAKPMARIVLSTRDLDLAISDAITRFHEPWQGRLRGGNPQHPKEHWTRIKALARRLVSGQTGYDTLRPVDDLRSRLQEGISRWLDRQATALDDDSTPEERLAALTAIRQGVRGQLQSAATERVATRYLAAWERAYEHSGQGSSYRRADEIDGIYRRAAPAIGFDKSTEAQVLLNMVYAAIQTAADEVGGRLE